MGGKRSGAACWKIGRFGEYRNLGRYTLGFVRVGPDVVIGQRSGVKGQGEWASVRMLRHVYRQPYDTAASEVDDVVNGYHLQIQDQLPGTLDGPRQDQSGTHVTGLPHVELSSLVARSFDLEDVESSRVSGSGLHLEDVCWDAAA